MKVKAFRIINQLGANGKIQVLLENGEKDTINYGPDEMNEFNAACTQLLSGKEPDYTKSIKRFIISKQIGRGNVVGLNEFLNEDLG